MRRRRRSHHGAGGPGGSSRDVGGFDGGDAAGPVSPGEPTGNPPGVSTPTLVSVSCVSTLVRVVKHGVGGMSDGEERTLAT